MLNKLVRNALVASVLAFCASRAAATNIDHIEGGTIKQDITLNVPSDYPTLQDAFDALSNRDVSELVTITIQIADGSYTSNTQLVPPRRVGANLQIIGNVSSPSSVVLYFPNTTNGLYLSYGQSIKFLNGVTIDGATASAPPYRAAIWLHFNSSIRLGSAVVLKRFSYGISANRGSTVECVGITATNNICGIATNGSSHVMAENVIATNNTSLGFYANQLGNIYAVGATTTGSPTGFASDTGGAIVH